MLSADDTWRKILNICNGFQDFTLCLGFTYEWMTCYLLDIRYCFSVSFLTLDKMSGLIIYELISKSI